VNLRTRLVQADCMISASPRRSNSVLTQLTHRSFDMEIGMSHQLSALVVLSSLLTLECLSVPGWAASTDCKPSAFYPKAQAQPGPVPLGSQFFILSPMPTLGNTLIANFMLHERPNNDPRYQALHNGIDIAGPAGTLLQPQYPSTKTSVEVTDIWQEEDLDGLPSGEYTVVFRRPGTSSLGLYEYVLYSHITPDEDLEIGDFVSRNSQGLTQVGQIDGGHLHYSLFELARTDAVSVTELRNPLRYTCAQSAFDPLGDNVAPVVQEIDASTYCSASRHEFYFKATENDGTGPTLTPYQVELIYNGELVDWTTFDQMLSKYRAPSQPDIPNSNDQQRTGIYEFYTWQSMPRGLAGSGEDPNEFRLSYCPPAGSSVDCYAPPCWEIRAVDVKGNPDSEYRAGCDPNVVAPIQRPTAIRINDELKVTWDVAPNCLESDFSLFCLDHASNDDAKDVTSLGVVAAAVVQESGERLKRLTFIAHVERDAALEKPTVRIRYSPSQGQALEVDVPVVGGTPMLRVMLGQNPVRSSVELRLLGLPRESVRIRVFDLQGRLVSDLGHVQLDEQGRSKMTRSARDLLGGSGLYFVSAESQRGSTRARLLMVGGGQ
jgi:hypothetical protein